MPTQKDINVKVAVRGSRSRKTANATGQAGPDDQAQAQQQQQQEQQAQQQAEHEEQQQQHVQEHDAEERPDDAPWEEEGSPPDHGPPGPLELPLTVEAPGLPEDATVSGGPAGPGALPSPTEPADSDTDSDSDCEGGARRAGAGLRYDDVQVAAAFYNHIPSAADARHSLLDAQRSALQTSVNEASSSASCPNCGRCGDAAALTPRLVTIVTWEQPVTVAVPQLRCFGCRQPFFIRPTALDCFPDTTVSWDLRCWKDGITVLWWHATVLQQFTVMQFFNRHLGMDRFCAAMLYVWAANGVRAAPATAAEGEAGGTSPAAPRQLTLGQLRKRLSTASQVYRYLRGLVEDYPESLPGWPRGALNGCSCCGDCHTCPRAGGGDTALAGGDAAQAGGGGSGTAHAGGGAGDAARAGGGGGEAAHAGGGAGEAAHAGGGAGEAAQVGGGGGEAAQAGSGGGEAAQAGRAAATAGSGEGGATAHESWRLPLRGGVEDAGPGPSSIHSAHFDCIFKLNLFGKRYKRDYAQLSRRRFFIRNDTVQQYEPAAAARDIGPTDCSNFTADKVLAKESEGKLITAAGVVVCRHGMLMRLLNLFHGERHMYSTAAAASILLTGTGVLFWFYDIACRWSKSWEKWTATLNGEHAVLGLAAAMVCLVPPFHSYAHSQQCQKSFGPLSQAHAGRGSGEVAEIFNSQAAPFGQVLRYTAPTHYEAVVDDVGRRYNRQVELGLPPRLYRMRLRAEGALAAASERIASLEGALSSDQVAAAKAAATRTQQRAEQPKRKAVGADPRTETHGWKASYARYVLALQKLNRTDTVDAPDSPPLGLLVDGSDDLPLRQRPALLKRLAEQKKELERENGITPGSWTLDSNMFKGALAELVEGEVKKLCGEVEGLVMDWHSLEHVIQRLQGRKKEQAYAKKEKARVATQLKKLWGQLRAWCRVQVGSQWQGAEERDRNAAILQAPEAMPVDSSKPLPWTESGAASSSARLVATLARSYSLRARAEEELALIALEVPRACSYYRYRVRLLESRLESGQCSRAEAILLSRPLQHCRAMLGAFEVLHAGGVPPNRSLLAYDED